MEKNVIEFPKKSEPEIKGYFHCAKCTEEVPSDMSISEYSDYDVGFTSYGIEVWCNRHNERVFYFDLTDIWETLNLLFYCAADRGALLLSFGFCFFKFG